MPRTPLFRQLQLALRRAQADEAKLDAARSSRRQFLSLAGAGGVALASGACRTARPVTTIVQAKAPPIYSPGPTSVAIVGGGLAGLHCAYRLAKQGVAATIFEASRRTGGRVFTDRMSFGDQHCELGGELIDTGHRTMHELAKELGIELLDYKSEEAKFQEERYFSNGVIYTEEQLAGGFKALAWRVSELSRMLKNPNVLASFRNPNGAEAIDRVSVAEWLDRVGMSPRDPIRRMVESAYTSEFGLDLDELSALNLLAIFPDSPGEDLYGDSDERYHAKEGSDTFIRKLLENLELWQVRYEHKLVAMERRSDGRWNLTFEQNGQTVESAHEHVVMAIPFSVLREVECRTPLPEQKQRVIRELGYGRTTKLMTGYSERVWRTVHQFGGGIIADLPFQVTWDSTRLQPGSAGVLTAFPGGKRAVELASVSAFEAGKQCVDQLARVFPKLQQAHNGRVARMAWTTMPLAKGSYSAYRPGQYTTLRGLEAEPVGNLYFAGEHTAEVPGYMNSAAESGARAAREVARALGIKQAA